MNKTTNPDDFKLELGQKVKDTVTGFSGIIVHRVQFLTGCNRYGVQPDTLDGYKVIKEESFDESRLESIKGKKEKIKSDRKKGGHEITNLKPEI